MSDDEYEIPLRDQRYFGSGLKRKRIHFVSSTAGDLTSSNEQNKSNAADKYLAIVLGKQRAAVRHQEDFTQQNAERTKDAGTKETICEVCQKPLSGRSTVSDHSTSIVHQICLQHSHPPSNIDRQRKGLAVLRDQGWDPDSRLGLGRIGEGRLHPVKAEERLPRAGLGAQFIESKPEVKTVKLDAGKVRDHELQSRLRRDQLHDSFYRNDELDKYLGQDSDVVVTRRSLTRNERRTTDSII